MLSRLLALTIAGLLLPTASASDLPTEPTPDSIAHVLTSGLVSISYTINPTVEDGDVVPLCDDAPDVPEDQDVLGAIEDDCFQPFNHTPSAGGPLDICSPVIVKIYPPAAAPDEECIEDLGEWVQRILSGDGLPGRVGIHIEK